MDKNSEKFALKSRLLAECVSIMAESAKNAKAAMDDAQSNANEETGATEEKFESFREQLQRDRDMYARQYQERILNLRLLQTLDTKQTSKVGLGTVVVTDKQNFFVATSIGSLKFEKETYFVISTASPLYLAMEDKVIGESFDFRGQKHLIKDIF